MDTWPDTLGQAANCKDMIALVTGGTGGIGFYVVKLLAKMGVTVIVPKRPGLEDEAVGTEKVVLAAAPGAKLIFPAVPLDLRSVASVRAFADHIRGTQPRIDRLCLNAGRGGGPLDPREITGDGMEARYGNTSLF